MLYAWLSSLFMTALCAYIMRTVALRWGIYKKVGTPLSPDRRSLPPVGGMAIMAGCAMGTVVLMRFHMIGWSPLLTGIVGAGGILFVVGWIDDFLFELTPLQKLVGECLAFAVLYYYGIATHITFLPAWANLIVSLIWVVAITNAMNLLDIADGLAGGTALLACGTLLIITLWTGQVMIAGLLAVLSGALIGFLFFNGFRATLFLGDSGSLLLGLLLALFTLATSYAPLGREIALLTPLLVMAVPLCDLTFVILMRCFNGRSPVKKSFDHFVFRLMRSGLSPFKALLVILGINAGFCVVALGISQVSNKWGLLIIMLVCVPAFWLAFRMAQVSVHD